jgi:hypothetical protein
VLGIQDGATCTKVSVLGIHDEVVDTKVLGIHNEVVHTRNDILDGG